MRSGYKQYFDSNTAPFYSIYNVGPYTFAPFKVVWRYVSTSITAAVASGEVAGKVIVPDCKLMLVACYSKEEAHYLCALLNSLPSQFIVQGYGIQTQLSTHILNHVAIRQFEPKNSTHQELAANSRALHTATAAAEAEKVKRLEVENLELAAAYWGLEKNEVADIKASLEELA